MKSMELKLLIEKFTMYLVKLIIHHAGKNMKYLTDVQKQEEKVAHVHVLQISQQCTGKS